MANDGFVSSWCNRGCAIENALAISAQEEVAGGAGGNRVRLVERGCQGAAPVAAVSKIAIAGNRRDSSLRVDVANSIVVRIGEKIGVRTDTDGEGGNTADGSEGGPGRGAAVAAEAHCRGTRNRSDFTRGVDASYGRQVAYQYSPVMIDGNTISEIDERHLGCGAAVAVAVAGHRGQRAVDSKLAYAAIAPIGEIDVAGGIHRDVGGLAERGSGG